MSTRTFLFFLGFQTVPFPESQYVHKYESADPAAIWRADAVTLKIFWPGRRGKYIRSSNMSVPGKIRSVTEAGLPPKSS